MRTFVMPAGSYSGETTLSVRCGGAQPRTRDARVLAVEPLSDGFVAVHVEDDPTPTTRRSGGTVTGVYRI